MILPRLVVLLALPLCLAAAAQEYRVPKGATIYIEEMEHDLDGYIKAEFVKQKVPLEVVPTPEEAELLMIGSSTDEERRKWHEGWLTAERDKTAENVQVYDKETKKLLWAGEAGEVTASARRSSPETTVPRTRPTSIPCLRTGAAFHSGCAGPFACSSATRGIRPGGTSSRIERSKAAGGGTWCCERLPPTATTTTSSIGSSCRTEPSR